MATRTPAYSELLMSNIQPRPSPNSNLSSIEKLPIDVVDRLLLFLSDYHTLRSAVLAAFVFYDAFMNRPGSIRLAVCQNEVGPAWPQAMALIKSKLCRDESHGSSKFLEALLKFDQGDILNSHSINDEEAQYFVRVSSTARRLEQHFANRQARVHKLQNPLAVSYFPTHRFRIKDISSATPLDSIESLRFQRALYRFWMFQPVSLSHSFSIANQLWQSLSRQEFLEITSIYNFCRDMLDWVCWIRHDGLSSIRNHF